MRKSSLVPLFAILLLAFAMPPAVLAGDVYHFRGEYVYASFYSTDSLGCIVTSVYLSATNGRLQADPGRPTTSSSGYIDMYQYNRCGYYQPISSGYWSGTLADGALNIAASLGGATLKTVVPVYDYYNGSYRSLSIDVTWTANDILSRSQSHYIYQSPGSRYSARYNGASRGAEVSGSVSAGSGNLAPGIGQGGISSSQNGSVAIY
jgi:hypothetical protein